MESKIIFSLIEQEKVRQETTINLIASENYADKDILSAAGSVLTNKYAEGYPNKRYYGGCQIIDQVENIAIENAKKLFNTEHANVQPHSGSSANFAVYFSFLKPGDTIMGMNLQAGGHLTHGHKINFSGTLFNVVSYGVNKESELIDYNQIETLAKLHRPKIIIAGASAYSRLIDFEKISLIAQNYGALFMVDMAHIAGLIAAKVIPSPASCADIVTSTTHKTLRGPRGGFILCKKTFAQQIDRSVMPGIQGGPLMHIIAAKAIAFNQAMTPEFCQYQTQVITNAKLMAQEFISRGYKIVSGGTDTHLFLIDLKNSSLNLTGKEAEEILSYCNIIVNRNSVPFDTLPPTITSGIRIGTPAVTTRGLKEPEVCTLVDFIDQALRHKDNKTYLDDIKNKILKICERFPIYK
jgi:glycine hydroxymethyltransferase